MKRHPADVIDSMVDHIPMDKVDLISELNNVKRMSLYRPPESMRQVWVSGSIVLEKHLCEPEDIIIGSWQETIVNIWMDK